MLKRFPLPEKRGLPVVPPKSGVSLAGFAALDVQAALDELKTSANGLSSEEANLRLGTYGANTVASEHSQGWIRKLVGNCKDPLSLLLLSLAVISYLTGDYKATVLIVVMLILSVGLRFVQELKADKAAEKLRVLVHTTATVIRHGTIKEVPLKSVVPGDVVHLSAGDMVPADVRILESRDLFINQASLTGESLPAEKHASVPATIPASELDLSNMCFMGTAVETGTAKAVVVATGRATRFGELASSLTEQHEVSGFDKGVSKFTWLMIRFILVMVPLVFVINGFGKGDWLQAFLFALAVAVGLTPELLPMIVTVNLSKGAYAMSRHKVIVKRLNAIQNFGAMDVLCTDKTGTLTEGRVVLIKHVDIEGNEDEGILDYAYLNSMYQTGLKNLLDVAVLKSGTARVKGFAAGYKKVDEIPFDFVRRRMSVVVESPAGKHLLVCKGAVEEVLAKSRRALVRGKSVSITKSHHIRKQDLVQSLGNDGFRLIALAYRELPPNKKVYTVADEDDLTLLGYLAFLDPPKPSAAKALSELARYGVGLKILTGDNELVTRKICTEVGIDMGRLVQGAEVETMNEQELERVVAGSKVFCKLEPNHKERIIRALQRSSHVVGYLGDGINDAPALKAADVGISVDEAVDIAKESSDIILLEKSLLVLKDGVREGRRVFGNIVKYLRMTASSNFGNMFSVVGASVFLPFLPMLPLQVITNNLLYDISQVTIPTDKVDDEYLVRPRQWRVDMIQKFILALGPVSSLFDYLTYFVLLYMFNAWTAPALFRTGWFVESLLTQTLIIHVIRTNKVPFLQSRASLAVTISSILICAFGIWLPFSPLAAALGFVPLPGLFFVCLTVILVLYFVLAHLIKQWFVRRYESS